LSRIRLRLFARHFGRKIKSGRVKGFWGERARCCNGDLTIDAYGPRPRLQEYRIFFVARYIFL